MFCINKQSLSVEAVRFLTTHVCVLNAPAMICKLSQIILSCLTHKISFHELAHLGEEEENRHLQETNFLLPQPQCKKASLGHCCISHAHMSQNMMQESAGAPV